MPFIPVIPILIFAIVFAIITIVVKFANPKNNSHNSNSSNNFSDDNYVTSVDDSHSTINYNSHKRFKNQNNLKNITSIGGAIYLLFFTICWNGILIFMLTVLLTTSDSLYNFLFFIPFLLAGVFLIVQTILVFIRVTKRNKPIENKETPAVNNSDSDDDEYFVKLCAVCGANLSRTDKYCPYCGKEIE